MRADAGRSSEAVQAGRLIEGLDHATIARWIERGFVPAAGRRTAGPFTGFPPIVQTELRSVSVERVDD